MPVTSNPLPADVREALQAGNKIEAIKLLRETTGLGLKESKDAIDEYHDRNPSHAVTTSSAARSGSLVWYVIAAVVVAAILAYYFLRSPG